MFGLVAAVEPSSESAVAQVKVEFQITTPSMVNFTVIVSAVKPEKYKPVMTNFPVNESAVVSEPTGLMVTKALDVVLFNVDGKVKSGARVNPPPPPPTKLVNDTLGIRHL